MSGKFVTQSGKLVIEYLEKYPEWPTLTIAKAIYDTREGKLLFSSLESVVDITGMKEVRRRDRCLIRLV